MIQKIKYQFCLSLLFCGIILQIKSQSFNQLWVSTGYGHSFNVFKLPLQKEREWLPVKSFLFGWQKVLNKNTSLQVGLGINQIGYAVVFDVKDNFRLMSPNARYRLNQFVIPILFNFSPTRNTRWQIQTGVLHGLYRSFITTTAVLEGDVFTSNGFHYAASWMVRSAFRVASIKKTDISLFSGITPVVVNGLRQPQWLCAVEAGINIRFKHIGE